jgi:hypothetical protein
MDERGLDIEKTKHRFLHGERIRDERTANSRKARMEAFGRGQIRECEDRPLVPYAPDKQLLIYSTKLHKYIQVVNFTIWSATIESQSC